MSRRIKLDLLILFLAGGYLFAAWKLSPRNESPPSYFREASARIPDEYADDAVCGQCHHEVAAAFQRSGMGNAWNTWARAKPIEDRSPGAGPTIHIGELDYQCIVDKGRLFQREFRRGADGEETELNRREAHYVLGSGRHGRAYIGGENGYLTQMPLSWYSSTSSWGASPGYLQANLRFERQMKGACVVCHNAFTAQQSGSGNAFAEPVPAGLGCQRCHGPAADHVAHQQRGDASPDPVLRLKRLSPDRLQDVCLQCHMQADTVVHQPGKDVWSFRPGGRLRDDRSVFFAVGAGKNFNAIGHGPRSMASRCFVESGGKMTCVFCHDPHQPAASAPASFYNQKCLDCHAKRPCKRPLKQPETAAGGDCVHCHMPKRQADDIPHVAPTEHWIAVPGRKLGSPFAHLGAAEESGLTSFWPEASPLQRAAGRLLLASGARNEASLRSAADQLQKLLMGESPPAERLVELGKARLTLGDPSAAQTAFERAVQIAPNSPEANFLLAAALREKNAPETAERRLEDALQRWPWHADSDEMFASMLLENHRAKKLLDLYQKYFQYHPPTPALLQMTAEARRRVKAPVLDVEAALAAAIRADGADATPYAKLAEAAARRGDFAAGLRLVDSALKADPRSTPARLARARIRFMQGRMKEARAEAGALLELDPANAGARILIDRLSGVQHPAGPR